MKALLLLVILGFVSILLFSQKNVETDSQQLKILTSKEKIELASLPELELPLSYRNMSVPYEVDNTDNACYSGLFAQSGYCCGQAACVANGFTYEINRVRNLDGSLVENKYPTHFAWNWENGGNGYYGASYYHSLVLLKTVGSPNMETYGGAHDSGGDKRFMTGYDSYYEGMHNRISKAFSINCSDEEGIMTLKHWLNDHIDGSDVGGIAFFYSQHQNPSTTLPVGTEHEGEKVCVTWGASPNHAMTITGYNDSIKWDYNGDGQYTNDIDISGDGIVDVRDWEIGGFKMCNTFGAPYNGWMMYRTVALASNQGGIWNNTANVVYPVKDYSPLLTYKVNLYYTKRGRIKVMAGISTDLSSTEPDLYMSFPIFDYQGDNWGMQGDSDDASCYMEFGLDVTPFLQLIDSNTPVKFYFQVLENDDDGWGSGEIIDFSVMDYSGNEVVEYISSETNVEILQNGITTVGLTHTPVFANPEITTATLPNANVYHDYSYQMEATGGEAPYRWEFDMDYIMTEISIPIDDATESLSGTYISLPFEFPFFDETYNGFYLNNNGYIDFSGESYSLPYNNSELSNNSVSFMHRKCIAAFMSVTDCTTYYISGSDYYIIKWVGTGINVSLKLQSSGDISIYYNDIAPENIQVWVSGISLGDLSNYSLTPQSGGVENVSGIGYEYSPMSYSEIFSLSESGLLTGIPTEEILAYPLNFKVTDARGMIDRKTIPISTEGLIVNYNISTPNNTEIEWGENVEMNLEIRNATESIMTDLVLTLSCDNSDVTINDGTENVETLSALEELDINDAFQFDLNYNFYNEQEIVLHLIAQTGASIWEFDIVYPVYTADIDILEYFVDDSDNNRLDIGETSDLYYTFGNLGGAFLGNISIIVSSSDPFLTINENNDALGDLDAAQNANASFNFTAHADCLPGHVAILNFNITGENGYENNIEGYVSIGQIVENWETANFESYNWTNDEEFPWVISDEIPHEGVYCLKSGDITHNQNSTIEIVLQVIAPGEIKFYRKVSCEDDANNDNYDYLVFYIDDIEKERWDSVMDWELESYFVPAGVHNFKWVYHKDVSIDANDDCAWIDFVEFPSIYDAEPLLTISATEINKVLYPEQIDTEIIYISNQGGGIINYDLEIFGDVPWITNARSIEGSVMACSSDSFYAGDTVAWVFTTTNSSTDNEWVEELKIDFPEGFIIDSITDFYDQSGDTLVLITGVPGDGSDFTWFGENSDGWGLLGVNESGSFTVYGRVNEELQNHMKIYYTIQGEVYGEEPHLVEDSIEMYNFGPKVKWVSASVFQGALAIGQEDEIALNFNAEDLSPGEYHCNLKIFASTDTINISVNLTVLNFSNTSLEMTSPIGIYPNPVDSYFVISGGENVINRVVLYDSIGQIILDEEFVQNSITVNSTNLLTGIYLLKVYMNQRVEIKKIIVK